MRSLTRSIKMGFVATFWLGAFVLSGCGNPSDVAMTQRFYRGEAKLTAFVQTLEELDHIRYVKPDRVGHFKNSGHTQTSSDDLSGIERELRDNLAPLGLQRVWRDPDIPPRFYFAVKEKPLSVPSLQFRTKGCIYTRGRPPGKQVQSLDRGDHLVVKPRSFAYDYKPINDNWYLFLEIDDF